MSAASTSSTCKRYSSEAYTIGVICALPIELAAAVKALDEEHSSRLAQNQDDDNSYRFGRIGDHNIVIGCLPAGRTGNVSAASVALHMKSSFPFIRFGLMVGIGGGVPSKKHDIRLGDVVVSQPAGEHGGVVQYDFGKSRPKGVFERTGSLSPPPNALLTTLTDVIAAQEMDELNIAAHLSQLAERLPKYQFPTELADDLYSPNYTHESEDDCLACSKEHTMQRKERDDKLPTIHYGTIASGSRVMKDALERDEISRGLGGVLCFEMEAAGLMNNFPCLVIRGISDYSDSHKNDSWQRYAAATAAVFAKELLNHLAPTQVAQTQTIEQNMGNISSQLADNTNVTQQTYRHIDSAREREVLEWLSPSSGFSKIQNETRDCRVEDTGEWLLEDWKYSNWCHSGGLFWVHGVAGCGKTVLSSKIIDDLIEKCKVRTSDRVSYWYFQFSSAATQDISSMLRSIMRQLICYPLPEKIQKLWKDHHSYHTVPSHNELLDVLKDLIACYENVFLVLDALDEYPEHSSPGRSTLLETLEKLLTQEHLHLIVTSRREPDIRKSLQPVAKISFNVDQALESDVEKFVDHALNHELIKRWGAELMSLAKQKLVHSEERRFRWTDLQVRRLRTCPTAEDFRSALNTIPKSLEETYQRALETIPDIHQQRVRQILIWLTSSFRELTSSEVAAVVAFPFVEDVLRICTSVLVTVIDGNTRETIKLAHFTVKEFLIIREGLEEGPHWYQFTARLANRCVTAQAVESVFGYPPTGSKVLFGYANQFWLAHARHTNTISGSVDCDEVQSRINSLLDVTNREQLLDSLKKQVFKPAGPSRSIGLFMHPIYYAILLGLKKSVMDLWEDYFSQSNQELGFYGNVLDSAACMGDTEVVMWLVDRIGIPSSHYDLPQIAQNLRINVPQTLRALLQKGPKPSINTKVMYALTLNPKGEEILRILVEEDLASIVITEELICAAANNKWNRKIVEYLVRISTHEFPVSFRTLLIVAGTSHSALQLLVDSRKENIRLQDQDYLGLLRAESAYTYQKLVSLGLSIPITTELIGILATSPSGSQILKLLLDSQTIEHPLTPSDVLTVAKGFKLETFESVLGHEWELNELTEELILAIASNCYLDPPVNTIIPEREKHASKIHRDYRPTLRRPTMLDISKALMSLIDRKRLTIGLTRGIVTMISEQFGKRVILHLVNRVAGICIFASDATYERFSSLIRKHKSDLGVSDNILQALDNSYKILSSRSVIAQDKNSTDINIVTESCHAAVSIGLKSLPTALEGLNYSTSEYEDRASIYVQPRVLRDSAPSRKSLPIEYDATWIEDSHASDSGSVEELLGDRLDYTISEDYLSMAHRQESGYSCLYCPSRFKHKGQAEYHQESEHGWRRFWSCAALRTVTPAFHKSPATDGTTVICGYCGDESNPANQRYQLDHLLREHRFDECNTSLEFKSAHMFREHIERFHAGTSSGSTHILMATCMREIEPPRSSRVKKEGLRGKSKKIRR